MRMSKKKPQKTNKVELLAPAKNFMSIKASGPYADAIYFGVQSFNMRAKSDNFKIEDLKRIAKICHNPQNKEFRKRKCYLTTNILIYEEELDELREVIQSAKDAGIDAVIVHDAAAIKIAKEIGIPFHISTQCNVSNSMSAQFYEGLGAERIILARECSLRQIKRISKKLSTDEIETFVHGAMCSSISGRCYLSQVINCSVKDSANRGRCTQPCRGNWKLIAADGHEFLYDGQKILNSRDMCMIKYVPQMIQSGIKSFKIEGRMRDAFYVEIVSKAYREAIDAYYDHQFRRAWKRKKWMSELKKPYNRGFTTGFFFKRATVEDSQLNTGANLSHWRAIEMGKVDSFLEKINVAAITLTNGTLRVGDKITIKSMDPAYDTFFHQKVKDMRIKGKSVEKTDRATEENPIQITLKVDEEVYPDQIDAIYKFTDETYGTGGYQLK